MGLLQIYFRKFVTVFRISFPLNILRGLQDGVWPNFAYALILTTSRLGLIIIFYIQYLGKYKIGIRYSFQLI